MELGEGQERVTLEKGTGKTRLPLLQRAFSVGGTQLWQPIIPWRHLRRDGGGLADVRGYYDTEFVRRHCLNFETGKGRIFSGGNQALAEYPAHSSISWMPPQRHPREHIVYRSALAAADLLELLFRERLSAAVAPEHKADFLAVAKSTLRLHRTITNDTIWRAPR